MSGTRTRHGAPVELPFQVFARQLGKLPPCQARCPNSGDIRGWLGIIAQRHKNGLNLDEAYDRAWQRLVEFNPIPATIGRICPHPCDASCNRSDTDGALAIDQLERFIGDQAAVIWPTIWSKAASAYASISSSVRSWMGCSTMTLGASNPSAADWVSAASTNGADASDGRPPRILDPV